MEEKYKALGYSVDYGGVTNKGYLAIAGSDSSASSGTYDVEVILDSTKAEYDSINKVQLADIQNLSGSTNAVYMDSVSDINDAYKYFSNYALGEYSDAVIAQNTTRNIEIYISSSPVTLDLGSLGTSVVNVYLVTASVQYSCNTAYLQDYAPGKYPQNPDEYIIFSNENDVRSQAEEIKAGTSSQTEVVSQLANIILCIQPRTGGGDDYITVKNPNNVDTNIYLVMQGDDAEVSSAGCKVHFDLYESAGAWIPASGDDGTRSKCRLRTNLLSNQTAYYGYHNMNNNSGISGQGYGEKKSDGSYEYKIGASMGGSGKQALTIMQADSLTPTHTYNRIYEITVNIYEDGKGSAHEGRIISMTGTVTDSIQAD
jgi:hypothetical protein